MLARPKIRRPLGRVIATFALVAAVILTAGLIGVRADDGDDAEPEKSLEEEVVAVTGHTVTIDGKEVPYEARTGTLILKEEDGTKKASVFFVYYRRTDVDDVAARPITFAYNGGPGSSSVWLHMGVFGPKRVLMDDEGRALPPPYRLVDNDQSILDLTDLVFIDPVSTGYSRPVPGEKAGQFHGVDEDVKSVGEFIRLFTTRARRWSSPKFLAGESYGTTRSAALSGELDRRHGINLNGIMLVSSILDFQTARFDTGNDLPYILFLPTYTATAWYHDQLAPDLQKDLRKTLDEVEAFALGDYAAALLAGDRLSKEKRASIVARLARYTGLSEAYIEQTDLRIKIFRFTKELRRDERRTVGRLDSRFVGIDQDAAGEGYDYDPSYAAIQGPYTATLNDYVRNTLGFESDLPYEILTGRVRPWSYGRAENRYLNVAETLRQTMTKNRHLKVFVANGYYDLATPYFATEHTFAHLGLDPELRDNVRMEYYESGHMMYIRKKSLVRMKTHMADFYRWAAPAETKASDGR